MVILLPMQLIDRIAECSQMVLQDILHIGRRRQLTIAGFCNDLQYFLLCRSVDIKSRSGFIVYRFEK